MILRFLNARGIAGIAVSLALAVLLVIQKGETRHWKKQSAGFEQLYHQEQAAFAGTVANYRAAADHARASDQANATRVATAQRTINERTSHDFEARLAAARATAERLRLAAQTPAHPRARGSTSVPTLSAPASIAAQAAHQDGLPPTDALTATEQAIQLDELIKWTRAQATVDNSPAPVASPAGD
jgi:hypothetical protein